MTLNGICINIFTSKSIHVKKKLNNTVELFFIKQTARSKLLRGIGDVIEIY